MVAAILVGTRSGLLYHALIVFECRLVLRLRLQHKVRRQVKKTTPGCWRPTSGSVPYSPPNSPNLSTPLQTTCPQTGFNWTRSRFPRIVFKHQKSNRVQASRCFVVVSVAAKNCVGLLLASVLLANSVRSASGLRVRVWKQFGVASTCHKRRRLR